MTSSWERYKGMSVPDQQWVAGRGLPDFPATYLPVTHGEGVRQPPIFDPALKQFARAFRAGEPVFEDERTGRRWRQARRIAIDHLVQIVADSPWSEHLVLRGSLLLEAWVGERAREPGDLDWVVPYTVNLESPLTAAMFKDVVAAATAHPIALDGVRVDADDIAVDDIWTYERAPGRRLVFTWHADGLPSGTVQLDFVFNEKLPVPPTVTLIPRAGGASSTLVQAVTPELSLAWKILWLASDMYPQGKDLYDAVLLAERVSLPPGLLRQVLVDALGEREATVFDAEAVRSLEMPDWAEFRAEYPQVKGRAATWLQRLARALS
ncbi:nucleotidyl transferase AbiEii/AbiGii toxin family protein [Nonomuraea sp. NPDC059194]|uniref:nucleotidyl transferase AbiEii/AbiGii toxin family protein n=1 Tax=Nonomuraea sp. NPDC059194 TaxID=3346764 RepID=UPI0036B32755